MRLDRTDRTLLAELQRDGRLTNRDLAERVHLSESACLRRVRALEEAGVIDRYAAVVSQNKVGLPGNVFVSITLNRQDQTDLSAFEDAVKRVPEVMECHLVSGDFDYLVKARLGGMDEYRGLLGDILKKLPVPAQSHSYVVMEKVKESLELPLGP